MSEINLVTKLDLIDKMLYRFFVIPITKKRLIEREAQFAWIYRKDFPDWGRGRDDAMNLTKYFMMKQPMDDTFGPTDMPSIWNLQKYKADQGMFMNFAGDSHDAYSVIMDSALGLLGAPPAHKQDFLDQVAWLHEYLTKLPAPKYPFPIDAASAETGKEVFAQELRRVPRERTHGNAHSARRDRHRSQPSRFVEQERGGDREQGRDRHGARSARAWSRRRSTATSPRSSTASGCARRICTTARCRACAICSSPRRTRPKVFYRGYDVYDPIKVGFVTEGPGGGARSAAGSTSRRKPTATRDTSSARR